MFWTDGRLRWVIIIAMLAAIAILCYYLLLARQGAMYPCELCQAKFNMTCIRLGIPYY